MPNLKSSTNCGLLIGIPQGVVFYALVRLRVSPISRERQTVEKLEDGEAENSSNGYLRRMQLPRRSNLLGTAIVLEISKPQAQN